jgi:phospholipid/cholesterol/gamma-HCH transport system substrate-binding protein
MSQNFRLGAFIVAGLAILGVGIFLIGSKESGFGSNYRVKSRVCECLRPDSIEGSDVRVGGIHKGAVRRIELPRQSDGKVTVVMDLAKETQNVLKQDSVASIQSEGLLGDKYVEVSFGSVEAGG